MTESIKNNKKLKRPDVEGLHSGGPEKVNLKQFFKQESPYDKAVQKLNQLRNESGKAKNITPVGNINLNKMLVINYKFTITLDKLKQFIVYLCVGDEENSDTVTIDLEGPLTPLPPSISKLHSHHLLEFQNGEKYIILTTENANFVEAYIKLYDIVYCLQNQMIRSEFNKSYDFACNVAQNLGITIEKPSHKKSAKTIVSEFWLDQVCEIVTELKAQGKKVNLLLEQIKLQGGSFVSDNNSNNPRSKLSYKIYDEYMLSDFQELIESSIKKCSDKATIIEKPKLEMLRNDEQYLYGNYAIYFPSGKVLGHDHIPLNDNQNNCLSPDDFFDLDLAIETFHMFYSGFVTITTDLNEIINNPSLAELAVCRDETKRSFLYLQKKLTHYQKMFNISSKNDYNNQASKDKNKENNLLLIEFWQLIKQKINNFYPSLLKAKKILEKFNSVLKTDDDPNEKDDKYPIFELKILISLYDFANKQIKILEVTKF